MEFYHVQDIFFAAVRFAAAVPLVVLVALALDDWDDTIKEDRTNRPHGAPTLSAEDQHTVDEAARKADNPSRNHEHAAPENSGWEFGKRGVQS